jgi:hypothetical protein
MTTTSLFDRTQQYQITTYIDFITRWDGRQSRYVASWMARIEHPFDNDLAMKFGQELKDDRGMFIHLQQYIQGLQEDKKYSTHNADFETLQTALTELLGEFDTVIEYFRSTFMAIVQQIQSTGPYKSERFLESTEWNRFPYLSSQASGHGVVIKGVLEKMQTW